MYIKHTYIQHRPNTEIPFNLPMPHMSYQIYDSEFASKNIDLSDDGLTKTTIRTMSPDIYLRWLSDNDVHDTTDDALQEKHYLDNNIKITRIVEVIDA